MRNINQYLPEYKYSKSSNRDWLCNVINTVVYDEFQLFIKNAMKNREKQLVIKRGFNIEAIPAIVVIFKNSQNVSYEKGRSHFLLAKYANRHKRHEDSMNVDRREESNEASLSLKSKIEELESKINGYKNREEEFYDNKEKLIKLIKLKRLIVMVRW